MSEKIIQTFVDRRKKEIQQQNERTERKKEESFAQVQAALERYKKQEVDAGPLYFNLPEFIVFQPKDLVGKKIDPLPAALELNIAPKDIVLRYGNKTNLEFGYKDNSGNLVWISDIHYQKGGQPAELTIFVNPKTGEITKIQAY